MLMQNFVCLGIVSVLWAVAVYSLAFSGTGGFIGNLDLAWMHDAGTTSPTGFALHDPAVRVPRVPADVRDHHAGADHRRDRRPHAVRRRGCGSSPLWVVIVYAPIAHWVFSPEGWLFKRGALDFAGGTVVHINAGIAALAAVLRARASGAAGPSTRWLPHTCRSP